MEGKSKERRERPEAQLSGLSKNSSFGPSISGGSWDDFKCIAGRALLFDFGGTLYAGMEVYVTREFVPDAPGNRESQGAIVRVDRLDNGQCGVAIHVFSTPRMPRRSNCAYCIFPACGFQTSRQWFSGPRYSIFRNWGRLSTVWPRARARLSLATLCANTLLM